MVKIKTKKIIISKKEVEEIIKNHFKDKKFLSMNPEMEMADFHGGFDFNGYEIIIKDE